VTWASFPNIHVEVCSQVRLGYPGGPVLEIYLPPDHPEASI
jgi:hypothetical protein